MAGPRILVRRAVPADAPAVARFNQAMALETEGRPLDAAVLTRGVQRVFEDPSRGQYLLAEADGAVVGQLLLTHEWSDWRDGWFWWIQSVYVAPPARRLGVYRALHERVVALAQERGDVRGVRLYVDAQNSRAQRAYERLGMVATHYRLFETDWSGAPARAVEGAAAPHHADA